MQQTALIDRNGNMLTKLYNVTSALLLGLQSPVPPSPSIGTAVMNGLSTNTMNIGSNVAAGQVWLYDPTTGNNVFQGQEYTNLSQFPGTFGFS